MNDIERLLKSAAQVVESEPDEMPLGFETRVVALWRTARNGNGTLRGLRAMVRRVALMASAVIIVAGAGVYLQTARNRDLTEPSSNEFAIADSVIQDEVSQ